MSPTHTSNSLPHSSEMSLVSGSDSPEYRPVSSKENPLILKVLLFAIDLLHSVELQKTAAVFSSYRNFILAFTIGFHLS